MKRKGIYIAAAAAAILAAAALVVVFATHSGDNRASAMWLVRAEGTVSVTDDGGADVPVRPTEGLELRLGLYDGYSVGTRSASRGWINLDDTKLTKLDENSAVTINRSGRELELVLDRGSLFFNVTKPLEDDETLEIRSSSMVMAVRGTSGWVQAVDDETFDVYIIEGKVRVTARTEDSVVPAVEQVAAGETARLSISGGRPSVTLGSFDEADVPEFVLDEAREDETIADSFAAIGIDTTERPDDGPSGPDDGPAGPDSPDDTDTPGGPDVPDSPEDLVMGPFGDVSWTIERVAPELSQELPEVYYQKPVFYGDGAGIPAINANYEHEAAQFVDERSGPHPAGYTSYYNTRVSEPVRGLVCVAMSFYEYDSQALSPATSVSYVTYDLATGRPMSLADVVDGAEAEIRALIRQELDKTEYAPYIQYSVFDSLPLDMHGFEISGDGVTVYISYSALGLGGGGQFSVPVILPLSARYGGPGTPAETVADTGWSLQGGILTLTPRVNDLYIDWENPPWREHWEEVRMVVAQEGVTAIGDTAFAGFKNLEHVFLPEGLTFIGHDAFSGCEKLRDPVFPQSLQSIGYSAFEDCDSIENVTIPENVTSIGISAFERCESLVFVRILGPVDTLQYTFDSCPLLQSVTLSEGTVLLEGTFQSCPRFVGLELPSTATNISNMTFKNSGIIVQSIPEGAAYIGVEAFMGCEDLEWLGLPASLTMIEKDAFFGIPSTATLVFGGTREQWERLNASGDTALPEGVNVLFNGGTN